MSNQTLCSYFVRLFLDMPSEKDSSRVSNVSTAETSIWTNNRLDFDASGYDTGITDRGHYTGAEWYVSHGGVSQHNEGDSKSARR